MKRTFISACILGTIIFASCEQNQPKEKISASVTTANEVQEMTVSEQDFIKKAYMGNLAEVQLGELASKKASNKEVKQFAEMMKSHHGTANQELKSVAQKKNITLADTLSSEMKTKMTKLQGKTGKDFDKSYMDMMVKEHQKTVEMYQTAMNDVKDTNLKNYIQKTLPQVKEHQQKAEEIKKTLEPKTSMKNK